MYINDSIHASISTGAGDAIPVVMTLLAMAQYLHGCG